LTDSPELLAAAYSDLAEEWPEEPGFVAETNSQGELFADFAE
jgi:hypothetical protein